MQFSSAQVREFFETGFVVVPDLFSDSEVDEMRAGFTRLERLARRLGRSAFHRGSQFVLEPYESGGEADLRIHRVVWCGAAEPMLSRYGRDRRLLQVASRLLGTREMTQLINQAHFKFPGDGVVFPWHQDSTHRRYGGEEWRDVNGRGSYVQSVVAIDPVNETNGALRFVPGSCHLGHVPVDANRPDTLPPEIDESDAVTISMRPGSSLFFGPFTFHSSGPNRSTIPRRIFINGYAYPGANSRVYPGEGAGRLLRV